MKHPAAASRFAAAAAPVLALAMLPPMASAMGGNDGWLNSRSQQAFLANGDGVADVSPMGLFRGPRLSGVPGAGGAETEAVAFLSQASSSLGQMALSARSADADGNWKIHAAIFVVALIVVGGVAAVVVKRRAAAPVADKSCHAHLTFEAGPQDGAASSLRAALLGAFAAELPSQDGVLSWGLSMEDDSRQVTLQCSLSGPEPVAALVARAEAAAAGASGKLQCVEIVAAAPDAQVLGSQLAAYRCRCYLADDGSRFYGARPPVANAPRGEGAPDVGVVLRTRCTLADASKAADAAGAFEEFYGAVRAEAEGTLHFGIAVDEPAGSLLLHESYKDAAGVLLHMENVGPAMKGLQAIAEIERLEVHGPRKELDCLRGAFGSYGAVFLVSDPCSQTWTWAGGEVAKSGAQAAEASAGDIFLVSARRMVEQFSAKMERGTRAREIVEEEASSFQEKAKGFVINELNTTANALLKAIDEEEATMLLEFNKAVEASFPPVAVLLAGITSPAILSLSYVMHMSQLLALFLPIFVGAAWSVVTDWGSTCDIPTMHAWTWSTLMLTAVLVWGHGSLAGQIKRGQKELQQKTSEIGARLAHNSSDGGTGVADIQEIFIGSTVLVQEALLCEDAVRRSTARVVIGPCTVLWIVLVVWNFVIVIGWTFVPGQISFYESPGAVAGGHFCGAWASVFTARVVCLLTPLFFFMNIIQVAHWAAVTAVNSESVSGSILKHARKFDKQYTGVPVVEILLKAFVLRGSHDIYPARLTVALGEALRLSKERDELEAQLEDVKFRIRQGRDERKQLQKTAKEVGDTIEANLEVLEQATGESTETWKARGRVLAEDAEKRARKGQEVATGELDRVAAYVMDAADKVKGSEMYQSAVQKAQQAAQDVTAAASEGLVQAQGSIEAGIAFAQSEEAQSVLKKAQQQATGLAGQASSAAADLAVQAQSSAKELATKAGADDWQPGAKPGR